MLKERFYVEQTQYSNDGGIDIIAISKTTLYKGNYLVQCKNSVNSVRVEI